MYHVQIPDGFVKIIGLVFKIGDAHDQPPVRRVLFEVFFIRGNGLVFFVLLEIKVSKRFVFLDRIGFHRQRLFVGNNGLLDVAAFRQAQGQRGEDGNIFRIELERFLVHLHGLCIRGLFLERRAEFAVHARVRLARRDGPGQGLHDFFLCTALHDHFNVLFVNSLDTRVRLYRQTIRGKRSGIVFLIIQNITQVFLRRRIAGPERHIFFQIRRRIRFHGIVVGGDIEKNPKNLGIERSERRHLLAQFNGLLVIFCIVTSLTKAE